MRGTGVHLKFASKTSRLLLWWELSGVVKWVVEVVVVVGIV